MPDTFTTAQRHLIVAPAARYRLPRSGPPPLLSLSAITATFFEYPVHFVREQAYEGKYVIQIEEPYLSAVEAVRLYKELSGVERAFANLKDVLDFR